jgi:translation initiation factor IF-2
MAGAKRLSKVARELNVGTSTIVEYLETQGHSIDSSPNTKIEKDLYNILLQEFQPDLAEKAKVDSQDTTREKRESISLEDSSRPASGAPKDEEEIVIKSNQVTEEAKEEKKPGVKVLGKIELKDSDSKLPKKKEEPKKEEPKKEEPKKEETTEKPAAKEEPKKEEKSKEEESGEKDIETIKATTEKLSGPTVVGKIKLPVQKEKSDSDKSKRKRKRIKKVNVDKAGKQAGRKPGGPGGKKGKQKTEVSEEEIQKEIKETLARLSGG